MNTWKLEIEYEGTRYRGWGHQHNERTIQSELQKAAYELFSGRAEIGGAENTDVGVHALQQFAHLRVSELKEDVKPSQIKNALNELLPHDINILRVQNAPDSFNARAAVSRQYLYKISRRRNAFAKSVVWWIKEELDADKMKSAAAMLVGEHSFESFCQKDENENQSFIVDIEHAEIFLDSDQICFRIKAGGFLWKMVRRIVGTLAEVGRGNLADTAFQRLLKFPSNVPAKLTAPPSGLFLEKIFY